MLTATYVDDPRHFPKTASGGLVWLLFRLLFVGLFIWNVMKLSSLATVLNPGDAVTLNINQLKGDKNIVLDIPTIDFRIENSILFFEAEFPTIQSIEVRYSLRFLLIPLFFELIPTTKNPGLRSDWLQSSLPLR